MRKEDIYINENAIGKIVVDCAVKLHRDLGPGLLESVYETLLTDHYSPSLCLCVFV